MRLPCRLEIGDTADCPAVRDALLRYGALFLVRQFLPGIVRHDDFGCAHVLDLDGRCSFYVTVVAVEADGAGNMVFVLGKLAAFEPELHASLVVSSRSRALSAGAYASEAE